MDTATNNSIAADLAEMMAGWNAIEAKAREQFPNATPEQLYQICASAMNFALGINISLGGQ